MGHDVGLDVDKVSYFSDPVGHDMRQDNDKVLYFSDFENIGHDMGHAEHRALSLFLKIFQTSDMGHYGNIRKTMI